MGYTELSGRYRRLRSELDAAYAVPVWNSHRIDQITEQMLEVERALAAAQRGETHVQRTDNEHEDA